MDILKRLFSFFDKIKPDPVKLPIAGESWWLKNDSPWPKKGQTPVKILDVKDGWVRYDMLYMFRDERMKIDNFLYCYRFNNNEEP